MIRIISWNEQVLGVFSPGNRNVQDLTTFSFCR